MYALKNTFFQTFVFVTLVEIKFMDFSVVWISMTVQ